MSLPATKEQALPDLVRRYSEGESLQVIAKEYKVSRVTLYYWMLGGFGDHSYEDILTKCLINRVCESDEELDTASDGLSIARAREKARFSRMDFERRRPHLYGPKQEVKHTGVAPSLHISVVQAPQSALQQAIPGSVTIEHDPK